MASLYVLCHHFLYWNVVGVDPWLRRATAWAGFGHFMVSVFIVLSGFSLGLQPARDPERGLRGGTVHYLLRRARRILPGYYAALALGFLATWLTGGEPAKLLNPVNLFSHLFLLHNWFPLYSHSYNVTLWSIATEWQIYFFLPLVFLPIWRRWGIGAAVLVGLVLGGLPSLVWAHRGDLDHTCPWYLGLFGLGLLGAAWVSERERFVQRPVGIWWAGLVGSTLLYLVGKFANIGEQRFWGMRGSGAMDTVAGLLSLCLILALYHGELTGNRGWGHRLLTHRWILAAGKVSYSIYLSHAIVLTLCLALGRNVLALGPDAGVYFRALVGIPLALLLATGFYQLFERPFLSSR